MKFKNLIILSIIFLLFSLNSCSTRTVREDIANLNLAKEFGIDSTQLVYQYYQKFGFTDLCEDIRMVAKKKDMPNFEKKLPISIEDLKIINLISKFEMVVKVSVSGITVTISPIREIDVMN